MGVCFALIPLVPRVVVLRCSLRGSARLAFGCCAACMLTVVEGRKVCHWARPVSALVGSSVLMCVLRGNPAILNESCLHMSPFCTATIWRPDPPPHPLEVLEPRPTRATLDPHDEALSPLRHHTLPSCLLDWYFVTRGSSPCRTGDSLRLRAGYMPLPISPPGSRPREQASCLQFSGIARLRMTVSKEISVRTSCQRASSRGAPRRSPWLAASLSAEQPPNNRRRPPASNEAPLSVGDISSSCGTLVFLTAGTTVRRAHPGPLSTMSLGP